MDNSGGITPDIGEISPDFDLVELLGERGRKSRESELSSSATENDLTPDDARIMTGNDEDPDEGEKTFELEMCPRFIDTPETRVVARHGGKRNRSPSPSRPEATGVHSKYGAKQEAYTSPSEIAKIFRNMITTDALCQLSAVSRGTPSDVKRIIPRASVDQICKMCDL